MTLAPNSPYRYLNPKVDGPQAYPENTLFKLHEKEIDAVRKFIEHLEHTDVKVCRFEGEGNIKYDNGDWSAIDVYYPTSKHDTERLTFATFDVDYDAYHRELNDMYLVMAGDTPRPQTEEPLTPDQAQELAAKVNGEGRYGFNGHTRHLYVVHNLTEEERGMALQVGYKPDRESTTWNFFTIRTERDYRRFLATLAAEVIYK